MNILTIISSACFIYVIWAYYKAKRGIKKAEEHNDKVGQLRQDIINALTYEEKKKKEEEEKKRKDLECKRIALGLAKDAPANSDIPLEKICTWENGVDGVKILRYTPPIHICPTMRHYTNKTYNSLTLEFNGIGRCRHEFNVGVVHFSNSHIAMPNDIIARFSEGLKAYDEELKRQQEEKDRRTKTIVINEKEEIAKKLKEKHRKRELEKVVRQELIDSGELFGDEPKRPPIPREVVDAVYKRDGGKCVYCGSVENLQLDHIIPFSKGGATTLENLQLLCQKCNLEKSNHIG